MTIKRLLGIGVAIIIYGVCAVGWADVKSIDPQTACKSYVNPNEKTAKIFANYKSYALLLDGQYVLCFKQSLPEIITAVTQLQPADGDAVVVYGLKLSKSVTTAEPMISISGSNVLLQNLTLTGPGSTIAGSTGLSLTGSNISVIASTVTGFETGIRADCTASTSASPSPQPSPEGEEGANCTIGPQNVIEGVGEMC